MPYFDDLYIVRTPPVTLAQWNALVRRQHDFQQPDLSLDCHITVGDVELDGANVVIWLGHSSGQAVPLQWTARHLYIPGIDGETVAFVHALAAQLDACVVHKVHPMNVVSLAE